MRESLFFPVMIASPLYVSSFFENLATEIYKFKTPEGVSIKDIYNASDQLTDHILWMVRKRNNNTEVVNRNMIDENVSLLEIVVETDHPLIYQRLPWLEEQILDYVRGYFTSVVLYLFYLIEGGETFQSLNIAKVYKDDDSVKVDESPIEDDMEPLFAECSFLNSYLYPRPGKSIEEKFPDKTARYYLLFGG